MFLGHFGLAFAAKKINPNPSLGTYFLASQLVDLLWPFFLLSGLETVEVDKGNTSFTPLHFVSYPYSHSLTGVFLWALFFGSMYYIVSRNRKASFVLAALVVSHWVLDFVTHRPDLPITFSEKTKVGLGLWNYIIATIVLELVVFIMGAWLYYRVTGAKDNIGRYAWTAILLFLIIIYLVNAFGEAPPSATAIGYVGLSQWLLIIWGYWIDRHRRSLSRRSD